jgi:hypothetical protein
VVLVLVMRYVLMWTVTSVGAAAVLGHFVRVGQALTSSR